MVIIVILCLIIGGLSVLLIKLNHRLQETRGSMYYYGLHLLGCIDDENGIYRCLDSDIVVSIGVYLMAKSRRLK